MRITIGAFAATPVGVTLGSAAATAHEAMSGHGHPHENALVDALIGANVLVMIALVLLLLGAGVYWRVRRPK